MEKTKTSAIFLVVLCTIFTSVAQVFYKFASKKFALDISLFTNYYLFIGIGLYGIAALMLIFALKKGELTILYPMIATGFLWVVLLSYVVFGEPLNTAKIAGILSIVIGVNVLGGKR